MNDDDLVVPMRGKPTVSLTEEEMATVKAAFDELADLLGLTPDEARQHTFNTLVREARAQGVLPDRIREALDRQRNGPTLH